jgi:DNA primase
MSSVAMTTKSYHNYNEDKWQSFKDKLSYIKSSIDPEYLLNSLGFTKTSETNKEIRCVCIIHGGDNKTAFRFNKTTNTWVCFTHKCHERYGNDVIGLVKAVTGKKFMEAVEYLFQFSGNLDGVDFIEERRKREIDNFVNYYSNIDTKPKSVNESSLKSFVSLGANYFLGQGFSKKAMDHFEIGHGWVDKQGIIRSVIPIRDDMGELQAYSLRDERSEDIDDDRKYILTSGFNKQDCLYNMNNAQAYGEELPIIVVEGFKSVWRLYDYGIRML